MKRLILILAAGIFTLSATSTAFAQLNQFPGRWENINSNTGGITALDIRLTGAGLRIRAWGQCQPRDCDWGEVTAFAYGPGVNDSLNQTAKVISAVFSTGFSETLLIIEPAPANRLRAEVFTRFTDNSTRANYKSVHTFTNAFPAPKQISPSAGVDFDHFPRTVTLAWETVPGAASYTVEVQFCPPAGCAQGARRHRLQSNLRTTSYTFDFVGAQPGRWRVWAVNERGQAGLVSEWREFRFSR